ncbi:MAG TPA: FecR domain-containing protein [Kofleriaceae bacterium]|nr:FecR domain-containing protein [Kofleriaceae bacterium]
MSRHVAPHRLADLAAGRLEGRDAARVRVHLDGCEACRGAWDRVRASRGSFAEIAGAPPPELKWDRMRAQVYWSMGSGSFPAVAPPRARWPWLAVPLVAATAAALAVWAPWQSSGRSPSPVPGSLAAPAKHDTTGGGAQIAPAPIPVELAPTPLLAVITLIEGDASLVRGPGAAELADADAIGATAIAAGARLSTAEGRVAVQLGAASVATLGNRSSLALGRLDEAGIELVVDGQVDIEVAKRAPDQRFTVLAGGRVVEVRGTAFRVVHRDGEVAVSCEHGRVAVSSGDTTVEVGAGQELALADADPLLGRAPRPLGDADLAALKASRVESLPGWTDPTTVLRTTRPFAVVAPRSRAVRVDGEIVGSGAIWMRVAPGRHEVAAETAPGRFSPDRWVTVDEAVAKPLLLAEGKKDPTAGTSSGRSARKTELERAIDRSRIRACVRKIESQGLLADTFVELEIGVDANGAMRFLNIGSTDLPPGAASCIRDTVSASRLGTGAAATWRHRINF